MQRERVKFLSEKSAFGFVNFNDYFSSSRLISEKASDSRMHWNGISCTLCRRLIPNPIFLTFDPREQAIQRNHWGERICMLNTKPNPFLHYPETPNRGGFLLPFQTHKPKWRTFFFWLPFYAQVFEGFASGTYIPNRPNRRIIFVFSQAAPIFG